MNNEIQVREGTLKDFDECCRLALAAVAENALVKPDPQKLLEHIYAALTKNHGIMGVIGQPGGRLEGGVLLRMGCLWYSSEMVLEEKVLYVAEEFRSAKGGRARKLAEWCISVSDSLGIPLEVGMLSNERTEGKIRLYERIFGKAAGVYFVHGGQTGALN